MNLLKTFILSLVLLIPVSVRAETLIVPVSDLLFDVPNFQAPRFSITSAINGENAISDVPRTNRNRREMERKLINMAYEIYPDAYSIRIWNGAFIIKLPNDINSLRE